MNVLFLGESGILASMREGTIAIDPVVKEMQEDKIIKESKNLKIIFITHEHKEHFDKNLIEKLFEKYRPYVVAPKHILDVLEINSLYKSDVKRGDRFELNGFEIVCINAQHPQSKYAVSYLIKGSEESIYHAGDTYEMEELYRIKADLGILPIRGMETMGAVQVSRMSEKLLFKKIMPVYWSNRRDLVEFMMESKKGIKPIEGSWINV
jgi:L-ascorbate metabolism protein UlaG (beta-lactamase superfamily)